MNVSSERTARAIIQRLRPNAKKHGLQRAIREAFIREHVDPEYRTLSWDAMKQAPNYEEVREEAEYRCPPFYPDLSEVYPDDREVIAFEIQDRCPVSFTKRRAIRHWLSVIDGWDAWSFVLVTTNGYGFGWHALIDTVAEGRAYTSRMLRENPTALLSCEPHLKNEAAIRKEYRWKHWRMPTSLEFEKLQATMSFI